MRDIALLAFLLGTLALAVVMLTCCGGDEGFRRNLRAARIGKRRPAAIRHAPTLPRR